MSAPNLRYRIPFLALTAIVGPDKRAHLRAISLTKRTLSPSFMPPLPSDEYKSRFAAWDEKAWVRQGKHHSEIPFEPELDFFSRNLSPLFRSSEVRKAPSDVQQQLLVLTLYDWLEFTEWLEVGPVNSVCDRLRQPHFLPWIPAAMKADALKIYTDEAGHAEMSHALARAVEAHTDVQSARLRPSFLDVFDHLATSVEPALARLVELFLAITSETLITGTLNKLPNDPTVQTAVREIAQDHAADEGRHHAYFRALCLLVWPRLPTEIARRLGVLLPDMILAFLEPDARGLARLLERTGHFGVDAGRIASEVCAEPATRLTIRSSCAPTLRMYKEAGLFCDPAVSDAFQAAGFATNA